MKMGSSESPTGRLFESPRLVPRFVSADERGFFSKMLPNGPLARSGIFDRVRQVNHSFTRTQGTVRGMHMQILPFAERKLITCLAGAVFDVVVDLRKGSPMLLKWQAYELTAAKSESLLVPAGFAHGFQTLEDNVELLYLHDAEYSTEAEFGVSAFDPLLGIMWPHKVSVMSSRDRSFADLEEPFLGVCV